MPQFISKQRSPAKQLNNNILEKQKKSTILFGGTTASRLARHLQQFNRQNSSPAIIGDNDEINNYDNNNNDDAFSIKSVAAWSVFGDIDTDLKKRVLKSQSNETVNELFGKIFQKDMFSVFLSLAKDVGNLGTLPTINGITNNKEQLTIAVYKEYRATSRLTEPYKRLANAIKQMENEYLKSKQHNLIIRYMRMQKMIYELVQVEREYWLMVDIPSQNISETPQEYALRIANLIDEQYNRNESTPKPTGGAISQLLGTTICIAERAKGCTLLNSLKMKTMEDLHNLIGQLSTELYRLIHRYLALRTAVKDLSRAYQHTRYYPLVPRYNLLKSMIKRILRSLPISEDENTKFEI